MGLARQPAWVFLTALLAVLGGCAGRSAQPLPAGRGPVPPGTFLDSSGGRLAPRAVAARLRNAAYILLGEEHPNACDHRAQAAIVRELIRSGVRPVIGLEMVPADRQGILDAFHRGALAVDDLPRALDWGKTWGFDFRLYAPLFEAAREAGLPVFAVNVPTGLARKVGHQGLAALSPDERASLPGAILPPDPAQVEALRDIFARHAAWLPQGHTPAARAGRDPFAAFLTVQSLWDTQMAARARYARALFGRPVVIVAGAGHVEHGYGIARRLAVLDPGARVLAVMPWRDAGRPDPALADFFAYCPAGRHE